ncbi:hypothetical protein ACFFU9_08890 [Mariniflexile ostreae]|uniref:Uncharacterized protein n=1 Tax=Mariniflexile ostreae TaxID=1520892 RepID=A0ABV5FBN8_9FLAO
MFNKIDLEIINRLVKLKIEDLNTFKRIRYGIDNKQTTKVSYETNEIANYLNNGSFDLVFMRAYLSTLKKEIIECNIKIIEFRPLPSESF